MPAAGFIITLSQGFPYRRLDEQDVRMAKRRFLIRDKETVIPDTEVLLLMLSLTAILSALLVIVSTVFTPVSVQAICWENFVQVHNSVTHNSLAGVTAISAGWNHFVVLKEDGTVWTWGLNNYGQLGDGTNTDRRLAVQVINAGDSSFLSEVIAVAAGDYHTLALRSDGTVWAWGRNEFGQLGNNAGGWGRFSNRAVQVMAHTDPAFLGNIIAISAGHEHSVALSLDGTVWTWGDNFFGQLGDGSNHESHLPVRVVAASTDFLEEISAISAAHEHTLALDIHGRLFAWGWNEFGQLGDGTNVNQNTPVLVLGPDCPGFLDGIVSATAGYYRSYAVRDDGSVLTWGWIRVGQSDDCATISRSLPVRVPRSNDGEISRIVAGFEHTAFLMDDSQLCLWGRIGEMLYDKESRTLSVIERHEIDPVHCKNYSGIIDVAAGGISTVLLMNDGTVWICCYSYR